METYYGAFINIMSRSTNYLVMLPQSIREFNKYVKEITKTFVIVNNRNIGIAIDQADRCSMTLSGLEITKSCVYNPVTNFSGIIFDIKRIDKAIIV